MHPFDRPLLLGLIALEQDFVSSADLIDAFRTWRQEPDESLGQILAGRGKLTTERLQFLERCLADSSLVRRSAGAQSIGAAPTTTLRPESTPQAGWSDSSTPTPPSRPINRSPDDIAPSADTSLRFKPLRLFAQGGLGQVFLAEDCELHRQVALKEIQPDAADDPASRRRFVAEAEITGNLEHPGVVPVYGLGVHADGRPFYAMRFIQGETLSAAIKAFHQSGPGKFASLDFRNLLTRLIGVCNAVAFAHSREIIHRDLKPANIMLGPFGETLVVDWGLAKHLARPDSETLAPRGSRFVGDGDVVTSAGEVIGTPAFMSPEQARGKIDELGPASDIYSLGAILHVLLTGQSPLRATSADSDNPAIPAETVQAKQPVAGAPRPLIAICQKAMAANASDRYASALDLAADIERWLADEPALAYAEPWTDTAFRWMRKNRMSVAVASALLLAASIALAIGYTLVRTERDIAQLERSRAVAANGRARENAAATRQVVEQFLIQIADDRWSEIPGFENVRLEMVSLAVERYRILLFQQPNDTALAADTAMAFRRCANLYRMIGRYEPASKLYEEALVGLRKAAAADPQTDRYERLLCETMCDRADLIFRERGPVAAESPMRDALDIGRRLREKQPNSTAARQAEARVQGDLADVLCELERYDEAVGLARSATAVLQRAADANPRTMVNRVTAAFSAVSFGQILRRAERWDEASAALEDAARRANEYVANHPSDVNLQYSLAFANLERAIIGEHRTGPTDAAQKELGEAVAALDKLAQQFPATGSFRRKLAEALTIQADMQRRRSQTAPAAESAQRAIELLTSLDQKSGSPAVYQSFLASAHLASGEIELARNDAAAAKPHLQQARDRVARARAANPASRLLTDTSHRIDSLLESIP